MASARHTHRAGGVAGGAAGGPVYGRQINSSSACQGTFFSSRERREGESVQDSRGPRVAASPRAASRCDSTCPTLRLLLLTAAAAVAAARTSYVPSAPHAAAPTIIIVAVSLDARAFLSGSAARRRGSSSLECEPSLRFHHGLRALLKAEMRLVVLREGVQAAVAAVTTPSRGPHRLLHHHATRT